MSPSLATSVGGVQLDCCVYNASGPRSGTAAALAKVAASASGAVLAKSVTLEKQTGNPLPRYNEASLGPGRCAGSINSEGLPNPGIDYFVDAANIDTVYGGAGDDGKPFILSLSGLSLADNLTMLDRVAAAISAGEKRIKAIELNLACPNIPGKPTVAYDFEQTDAVLKAVTKHACFKGAAAVPLGVKLAPYLDMPHYKTVAAIINSYAGKVKFVVAINTVGNGLVVDADAEMATIAPKGGFGGLGGGWVKPVALANVRQLRLQLDASIDVVGVGGISTGTDAFEFILCGASAVQVGTQHWSEGPKCFERISDELKAVMAAKGYSTIKDFQGTLRAYDKTRRSKKTAAVALAGGAGAPQLVVQLQAAVAVLAVAVAYLLAK